MQLPEQTAVSETHAELRHECSPEHLRMGTVRLKYKKETKARKE